ncbi:MAG: type pilus assembly protein PilM [Solirubrobacteraceae bacterium]|nr:type pilus assembly protein PilM [Solirubrobacteraceae bacterium]
MPRLTLPTLRSPRRSERLITGLDIEPGAVHAAQVSVRGGLSVEKAASAPLAPGVVRDGEVTDTKALAESLSTLFATHKLDKRVRIGVANQRVIVRHLVLPPIEDAAELATAVHFQAQAELPMPIDQAVLRHVSLGVSDTPDGPRQRVLVVAARRDMIERLLGAVRAAGLRPEGIDLSAFGMLRALPASTDGLVLHLAVGGLVNLAVTRAGECVFTRVITGGIETMAIDLAERREMHIDDARALLLEAGLPDAEVEPEPEPGVELEPSFVLPPAPKDTEAGPIETARQVLADGVARIAGEVRNSLDFHLTADLRGGASAPATLATVERVLLTGSALAVPGLDTTLARHLALPVERADVDGNDPALPGSHAVAAGLAIEEALS